MSDFSLDIKKHGGIKILGDKNLIANIESLRDNARRQVIRSAMAAGAHVIRKKAREKVVIRTGLMKKAIKVRVTRGDNARIFVDPRVVVETDKVDKNGKTKKIRPSKYAHLVEFGTSKATPHPFLRPALEEGRSAAFSSAAAAAAKKFDILAAKMKTEVKI